MVRRGDSAQFQSMVRTAQSVLHRTIHDRQQADSIGYGIADFVTLNWATVSQDFGRGAEDELEVVERVAQLVVRQLADGQPQ